MDDNENRSIDLAEFKKGLADFGVTTNEKEIEAAFKQFDKNGSGAIDFDEFIRTLRVKFMRKAISLIHSDNSSLQIETISATNVSNKTGGRRCSFQETG